MNRLLADPQLYFDYLRGGPAEPLAGVFPHNQMDFAGWPHWPERFWLLFDSGNGFPDAAHHSAHDPLDLYGLSA